jgi:hypothetical protein
MKVRAGNNKKGIDRRLLLKDVLVLGYHASPRPKKNRALGIGDLECDGIIEAQRLDSAEEFRHPCRRSFANPLEKIQVFEHAGDLGAENPGSPLELVVNLTSNALEMSFLLLRPIAFEVNRVPPPDKQGENKERERNEKAPQSGAGRKLSDGSKAWHEDGQ